MPVGARASAVGNTIIARPGPDAVFGNPAGLAGIESASFVIHHSDMDVGAQIDAFSLLLTPFSSAVGLSYQLFNKGDVTTTDPQGQPTGELSLRDHLVVATFGTALGAGLSMGLSYKLFHQRIDCTGVCGGEESVGTTHAADFGLMYSPSWHSPLELGAALVNLGFPLQVENAAQADPFPARFRAGLAYDLLNASPADSILALRLSLEMRGALHDLGGQAPGSRIGADPRAISVGVELDFQRTVFLRAGWTPGEGLGTGAAVGVELRYDRFDIAVARSFVNSILEADQEPFQVSFGVDF